MRSRDQIISDCENRFNELLAQQEERETAPLYTHPCTECRFYSEPYDFIWSQRVCNEPLVKGFGQPHVLYHELDKSCGGWQDDAGRIWHFPDLCGQDKALWRPKLSLTDRLLNWLTK